MMAVEVEPRPTLRLSKPVRLLADGFAGAADTAWYGYAYYEVTPDSQRFLMIRSEEEPAPTRIHVILNWADELKKKVPVSP